MGQRCSLLVVARTKNNTESSIAPCPPLYTIRSMAHSTIWAVLTISNVARRTSLGTLSRIVPYRTRQIEESK